MENRKFIKIILVLAGMIFIPVFCVDAYASKTTHPALTQEVIKLFERYYPQHKFTDTEKAIIEKGSADEDVPIYRSFSHFYDPIYERGLWGFFMSAKKWARDTRAQAKLDPKYTAFLANMTQKLFGSDTDFTFDRAVFEYVHKNKDRALEALGHILHLIEDMDVPAHTRDDSHILGDPLEVYADRFVKGREDVDNIADGLIKEGKKPIIYDNLDEYFYNLALFSNQNFFSEDTILIEKYAKPIIVYEKTEILSDGVLYFFGYENEENGKIIRIKRHFNFITGEIREEYFVEDIDNLILSDNWNALSKQAVLYGAGVVKLFFDAVEEEKKTLALYKKNESWFSRTKNKIAAGFSNLADRVIERVSEIIERTKNAIAGIDPQDMLATVGESENKKVEATKEVKDDFEKAVLGESPKPPFQNRPAIPKSKPEDPNSPELQRLALILRETERMVARLEKGINDLEKVNNQAVGGTVENLVTESASTPVAKQSFYSGGGGGGGGGGGATAPTASPDPQNSQENNDNSTDDGEESANKNDNNNTTTPGSPSLEISQCDNSFATTTNPCLLATTTLDVFWATTTVCADFAYFNLSENGIFATTTATTTQITNLADGDFIFSVAITDTHGNISATTTKTATISPMPIVINEIAWKGTSSANPSDEWIELYNRSNADINLDDWILYSQDGSPDISLATTSANIISAKGYYLIERTDDTTISDITADLIVPFSGQGSSGLGNTSGEHLILAYKKPNQATTTIDEAPFADGWPAPDGYRTLERQNPDLSGTDANNWALVSDNPNSWNGLDANGNAIKGTPGQKNSDGSIMTDTTLPGAPSLEISQCDNSISASSCLIATTTLDIFWATTTPCADFAYFNIDENGIFTTTIATTTQITNLAAGDFTFSVATVDTSGNISATTTKTAVINMMPIVINEIAWAGTDFHHTDEWIELYNRSGDDIDLSDWMLYSQDGLPDLNFLNATNKIIEAGSYYLIESQDDNTISDISADLTLVFDENSDNDGLSNDGEHLILSYKKPNQATTTVDEVYFAQGEGGWVDKNNTCDGNKRRTLERYNPDYICANINDCRDNWVLSVEYTASYDLLNGLDAEGKIIRGTPRARNSVNYKIAKGDTLTENKILTQANSPYFVGADGLIIAPDVTLTIEPGVVIKIINRYGDAEIIVKGAIQANGSATEPIIFTSFADDAGGDTNGDGACISGNETPTCPGEGVNFWSQIIFNSSSEESSFNNTIFRYGGNRLYTTYPVAMVVIDGATVNFANSTFDNSYTSGAYFDYANSNISNCIFQNNKTYIAYNDSNFTYYGKYYGLVALRSDITVQNSDFNHNQVGLGLFDTVGAMVDSNSFNNNTDFPVIISSSPNINIANNSGANNGIDGINIFGYITNTIATTTLTYNPLPYILDNSLEIAENTILEIAPKTVFKFAKKTIGAVHGHIGVNGYLKINGGEGEGNRVLFTSIYDDDDTKSVGEKIINNSGISLHSASSTIENAEFRFLDKPLSYLNGSAIDLKDIVFTYNTWSIYANPAYPPVIRMENIQYIPENTSQSVLWP